MNASLKETEPSHCLNCDREFDDSALFCSHCGQKTRVPKITLLGLIVDFFVQQFAVEGRLFQTLRTLFFFPGRLTLDYWAGRRARYFTPIQIYLVSSVIFFLTIDSVSSLSSRSMINMTSPDISKQVDELGLDNFELTFGFRSHRMNKQQFIEFMETDETQLDKFFERHGFAMDSVSLYFARIAHVVSQPEGAKRFVLKYFRVFSQFVIVLMPAFGFFLYGLYWRRADTSVICIVFSAHFHAFAYLFLIMTVLLFAVWPLQWLPAVMAIAVFTYFVCSQRQVFGGNVFAIILKSLIAMLLYFVSVLLLVILLLPLVYITL